MRDKYDEFMIEYNRLHAVCPVCGCDHYSCTLVGYIVNMDHPETYKDRNSIECMGCGFKVIVHDLVLERDEQIK